MSQPNVELLLREAAPTVLGVLVRRHGGFDVCEDAVQEALLAAATSWPVDGVPVNPTGWLITTATRRLIEMWRRDAARRGREQTYALTQAQTAPVPDNDDTLALFFLCCHPALTGPSQVALTLRAVGGLTTAEIARALLVPEATLAQRISRAKARLKASGEHFAEPTDVQRIARLPAVTRVLYLVFNEGHTASSGTSLQRVELTTEAIRLTRQLHERVPDDGEVAGLLALMLLTDARRRARTGPDGTLIPLAEQDRSLWNADAIGEGTALITATLPRAMPGPFQVQAAIAAVHDEAAHADDTDWPQIVALYNVLESVAPGPMVTLNRIVAEAMVRGPAHALAQLDAAAAEPSLAQSHRTSAVRAHLLEELDRPDAAREHYMRAARLTRSLPERRYLLTRAARLNRQVQYDRADSSGGERR